MISPAQHSSQNFIGLTLYWPQVGQRRSDGGANSGEFFLVGRKGGRQTADKKRSKNFVLGSPQNLLTFVVDFSFVRYF